MSVDRKARAAMAPVLSAWDLGHDDWVVAAAAEGNINDTFFIAPAAANRRGAPWQYVLQRINRRVFPEPAIVVENQRLVVEHVHARAPGWVVPLLRTRDGRWHFCDGAGDFWRLQPFLASTRTLASIDDVELARAAGHAFGRFQTLLADLPTPRLGTAIPHFHDLGRHFEHFDAVVGGHCGETGRPAPRLAAVTGECRFVTARRHLCEIAGRGPIGAIHGDCKVSNLLFDRHRSQVSAIIDLDTVMVGDRTWDFGDLVRSAAAGVEERQPRPLSMARYRALATGFIDGSRRGGADAALRHAMVDAPAFMTFMLGLRFLIDYLEGDRYFRVHSPEQNLRRARSQFTLVAELERARASMARVINVI